MENELILYATSEKIIDSNRMTILSVHLNPRDCDAYAWTVE